MFRRWFISCAFHCDRLDIKYFHYKFLTFYYLWTYHNHIAKQWTFDIQKVFQYYISCIIFQLIHFQNYLQLSVYVYEEDDWHSILAEKYLGWLQWGSNHSLLALGASIIPIWPQSSTKGQLNILLHSMHPDSDQTQWYW